LRDLFFVLRRGREHFLRLLWLDDNGFGGIDKKDSAILKRKECLDFSFKICFILFYKKKVFV